MSYIESFSYSFPSYPHDSDLVPRAYPTQAPSPAPKLPPPAESDIQTTLWEIPVGNSLEPIEIAVGSTIEFEWFGKGHSLWQFPNAAAYEACDFSGATEISNEGPAQVFFDTARRNYFGCHVGSHCLLGQKVVVTSKEGQAVVTANKALIATQML